MKAALLRLVRPVIEIFIGILLLTSPEGFVKGIIVTFGLSLIICGVTSIVPYIRKDSKAPRGKLIFSAALAIAGLIIAVCCKWIAALIPAVAALYGAGLLISAGVKIPQIISDIGKGSSWILDGFGVMVLVILGVLALIHPFAAVTVIAKFIAAGLFIDAVISIIAWFLALKQEK